MSIYFINSVLQDYIILKRSVIVCQYIIIIILNNLRQKAHTLHEDYYSMGKVSHHRLFLAVPQPLVSSSRKTVNHLFKTLFSHLTAPSLVSNMQSKVAGAVTLNYHVSCTVWEILINPFIQTLFIGPTCIIV